MEPRLALFTPFPNLISVRIGHFFPEDNSSEPAGLNLDHLCSIREADKPDLFFIAPLRALAIEEICFSMFLVADIHWEIIAVNHFQGLGEKRTMVCKFQTVSGMVCRVFRPQTHVVESFRHREDSILFRVSV